MPEFRIPSRGPARPRAPGSLPEAFIGGGSGDRGDLPSVLRGLAGVDAGVLRRSSGTPVDRDELATTIGDLARTGVVPAGVAGGDGRALTAQSEMQLRQAKPIIQTLTSRAAAMQGVGPVDYRTKTKEENLQQAVEAWEEDVEAVLEPLNEGTRALAIGVLHANRATLIGSFNAGYDEARDQDFRAWAVETAATDALTVQELDQIPGYLDRTADMMGMLDVFGKAESELFLRDAGLKLRNSIITRNLANPLTGLDFADSIRTNPDDFTAAEQTQGQSSARRHFDQAYDFHAVMNIANNPDIPQASRDISILAEEFNAQQDLMAWSSPPNQVAERRSIVTQGYVQVTDNAVVGGSAKGYLNGTLVSGGPADRDALAAFEYHESNGFLDQLRNPDLPEGVKSQLVIDSVMSFKLMPKATAAWIRGQRVGFVSDLLFEIGRKTDGQGFLRPSAKNAKDLVVSSIPDEMFDLARSYRIFRDAGQSDKEAEASSRNLRQVLDVNNRVKDFDSPEGKKRHRALIMEHLKSATGLDEGKINELGLIGEAEVLYESRLSQNVVNPLDMVNKDLDKSWGPDYIFGLPYTKNPAMKVFGDNGTSLQDSWLGPQLQADLDEARGGDHKPLSEYTPEILQLDAETKVLMLRDKVTGDYDVHAPRTDSFEKTLQSFGVLPHEGSPVMLTGDINSSMKKIFQKSLQANPDLNAAFKAQALDIVKGLPPRFAEEAVKIINRNVSFHEAEGSVDDPRLEDLERLRSRHLDAIGVSTFSSFKKTIAGIGLDVANMVFGQPDAVKGAILGAAAVSNPFAREVLFPGLFDTKQTSAQKMFSLEKQIREESAKKNPSQKRLSELVNELGDLQAEIQKQKDAANNFTLPNILGGGGL